MKYVKIKRKSKHLIALIMHNYKLQIGIFCVSRASLFNGLFSLTVSQLMLLA